RCSTGWRRPAAICCQPVLLRGCGPEKVCTSGWIPDQPEITMETMELHRGRLFDHIQLVVSDLDASRRFYEGVLAVFGIPIGGSGEGCFCADDLVASLRYSDT